ncbi:uncharacterized protein B0H18DRAFT_959352 [Fomitopsis serialis]|uniref:uncharacterized protein n=1 Tax=Fomitopsis serialis TaxID=139415 RepID=UPI0020072AEE|nr:uncharacterized protein B0H18DRAFT_959352 [Neoantrodia serialis]KAH9915365.1 hypothetical protein B0H18DRAFT_959352 [Neoantrodia serialis]
MPSAVSSIAARDHLRGSRRRLSWVQMNQRKPTHVTALSVVDQRQLRQMLLAQCSSGWSFTRTRFRQSPYRVNGTKCKFGEVERLQPDIQDSHLGKRANIRAQRRGQLGVAEASQAAYVAPDSESAEQIEAGEEVNLDRSTEGSEGIPLRGPLSAGSSVSLLRADPGSLAEISAQEAEVAEQEHAQPPTNATSGGSHPDSTASDSDMEDLTLPSTIHLEDLRRTKEMIDLLRQATLETT